MSWAAKQQTLAVRLRQTSIQECNAACPLEKMTRNGGSQPGGGLLSLVPIVDIDSHLEQIGVFEALADLSRGSLFSLRHLACCCLVCV